MSYKLTPSSLSVLKDCPRCFWLEHNKQIKRPRGIFPSLPSGMDRILKDHFDFYMEKDELPPELKKLKGIKLFSDKSKLDVWRNNWKGIQWTDNNGNILKGAVDAMLQKGDKLIVADYKTRGYPLKENTHTFYQQQVDLYNLLLRKNNYATEDYAYLLFYHPNKVIESVFHFHVDLVKLDVDVKNAERVFSEALSLLEKPIPPSSAECEYCSFRNKKVSTTLMDF